MKIFLGLVLVLASLSSLACDISSSSFMAKVKRLEALENNPHVPSPASPMMTEKEFKEIMGRVQKVFAPYFKNRGKVFSVHASWKDDEANAYASQEGNEAKIMLSGGYARIPYMSRDAYYTVICHEIGHHLGGFPRKQNNTFWPSTEGQADYYSTAKCMKMIMKFDPNNKRLASRLELAPEVKALCRKAHKTEDDYHVCLRSVKAAEDYGRMMYFRRTNQNPEAHVSLSLRDTNVVTFTQDSHPEAQCRLDTKFEGALCAVNERINIGEKDEVQGVCHPIKGDKYGVRPGCWFASALRPAQF